MSTSPPLKKSSSSHAPPVIPVVPTAPTPANSLEALKLHSFVVADSGDVDAIAAYHPTDATTNPSLILAAASTPRYASFLKRAKVMAYNAAPSGNTLVHASWAFDYLICLFGVEILKVIPGRVSTEVDPKCSFDVAASIEKGKRIIAIYKELGYDKERILIKLAATWEGIQAARVLEAEHGIHCNLTLIFSFPQAVMCGEAGVTLISPFVGRILDWYKASTGKEYAPHEDPGVKGVQTIYNYYKKHDIKTIVMGASFRNIGEIEELTGCDYLTISPSLLKELQASSKVFTPRLTVDHAKGLDTPKVTFTESEFRWALNQDQMATEKLADGIRKFSVDAKKVEDMLAKV